MQAEAVFSIRPETRHDWAELDTLLYDAFGGPQVPGLVRMIRESSEYEPELALVAEEADELVGVVLLSRLPLLGQHGRWWPVLVLSPLAVRPDRGRRGIGSALVGHALAVAERKGEALVVLEGDPGYYRRFGFEPAAEHGLARPSELIPAQAFQVLTLSAYDPRMRGRVVYPEAFWRSDAVGPARRRRQSADEASPRSRDG